LIGTEDKRPTPKEIRALLAELDRIEDDPEMRERTEELHRQLTRLTAEDLMRPFTI